jgi:hypothetical protein
MPSKPSKPIIDMPSKQQLKKLVRPLTDEEINNPAMDERIEKLMKFFDQYGIQYDKFKPEFKSFIPEKKKAYPNYDQYIYIPGQHDTRKWLLALKDIHYKQKAGLPYKEAIKGTVGDWKKMEVYDFLNWLKYYNEGTPMKYKFAQVWYENGQPGYFLHIKPDAPKEEVPVVDHNAVQEAQLEAERNEEKRSVIEKQRQKIIGRLDSAEKLLRSPEGQQFAGSELEQLMEAIYTLKKKVQLVNKLSVSTRLYEDMIVREGNVLRRSGFNRAAEVLYSLAQSPGQSGEAANGMQHGGKVPMDGQPPADPSGAGQSGMPNGYVNLSVNDPTQPANVNEFQPGIDAFSADAPTGSTPPPPTGPAPEQPTAQSTPAIIPQGDGSNQPKGIKEFIENMNDGAMTEASEADDQLEVFDEDLMVTEAQVAPPGPPGVPPAALEDVPTTDTPPPERGDPANLPPPTPKPLDAPKGEEPLEVTENDIPGPDTPSGGGGGSALDSKIDATFDSVTMAEIVAELEDISKYYKVREMPRRLARLDMMFDSKGISAYFPSLAEAQNRALDANNYIATRIDDILSKVRGSLASENMAGKLQQDQDKEKKRKEMRKEQENAELEGGAGKEAPNVEMGELAPPAAPAPPPPVATPPAPLKRPAV